MRIWISIVILACGPATLSAAPPTVSPRDSAFFETRIRPVLLRRCFDCHGPDTENEAGLRLDSLAAMLTGGRSGPAIKPGDPDNSLLVLAIRHDPATPDMPPKTKLPLREAADLAEWIHVLDAKLNPLKTINIAMVGKYMELLDAYKSLNEALIHGGMAHRVRVKIKWLDAEVFEQDDDAISAQLEPMHAILVPGGFGERGSEGKIAAVRFAREHKVPFLGICLGMQMACIEGARSAGVAAASSTEFGETEEPVVGIITEWMSEDGLQEREAGGDLGGTMRLGAYDAKLSPESRVSQVYGGVTEISERHRHRYEVNSHYIDTLEKEGLVFSGMSPDGTLPEIVERPDHPWFVGVQFHPESIITVDGMTMLANFARTARSARMAA